MQLLGTIKEHLPLSIERASFDDSCFSIGARDWSFDCWSPWRLSRGRELLASSHACSHAEVQRFVGRRLTSVQVLSQASKLEPAFGLDDGTTLEIFVVQKDKPWALFLPDEPVIAA
jgi:hypothetical protein